MMGRQDNGQDQLFYQGNLDVLVPEHHLLRYIDQVLDLSGLRDHLASFYSRTGRPSIDPELMIRMLLIGYCFGLRSERRLCEEVQLNLAYRWFCRLTLEDKVPDHSTFSKARHGRFRDSDALRYVFEQVVERCIERGLVGGSGFAIDASVIKADANRQKALVRDDDDDWPTPNRSTRPVREYLEDLDEAVEPAKRISTTDPAARWTAAPGGPAFFAYSTNYLIDIDAGIIMDVEPTAAYRTEEVESTKTMVDRVEARFEIKPQRLIGDTAYGNAELLSWMVDEKDIEPHVPVWDKSQRKDGTLSRSDFDWDEVANVYHCPGGQQLQTTGKVTRERTLIYRSKNRVCAACPHKQRCCPNTPNRKITRSVHEAAREAARQVAQTPAYLQSRRDRKKVEMLFGHLKRILKLDRLRLRGMSGARDEFILAATAQNLRRMALRMSRGPPYPGVSVPV
jgi:transposase